MTWNYRIIKYKDGSGYGLHEVFYDKSGRPAAMTVDPINFSTDSEEGPNGIVSSLSMALADAIARGVFEEPEEWQGELV